MRRYRRRPVPIPKVIAAASLAAAALLTGCQDSGSPVATTTSVPPVPGGPATTGGATGGSPLAPGEADALRRALLVPEDVPGSRTSASEARDLDYSACFPGNPLAVAVDPYEVESPDLEVNTGGVRRNFASTARKGTVQQAQDLVTALASPEGTACVVDALKRAITGPLSKIDPSALQGTASTASVADGGSLVTIAGELTTGNEKALASFDLLVFRKGGLLVLVALGAIGGPGVPAQATELASKIAGRLP